MSRACECLLSGLGLHSCFLFVGYILFKNIYIYIKLHLSNWCCSRDQQFASSDLFQSQHVLHFLRWTVTDSLLPSCGRQWFSPTLIGLPLNGSERLTLYITLNWHWHTLFPGSLTAIKLCFVPGVSLALFFHFMPLLMFPTPSPSLHLQDSRRACKGVLIERNINLQVTNYSRGRAGAGV